MNNATPSLLLAATEAAGHQHYAASTLYVVATPIGNMADMTLRAIHVLARVDAVACEDTRVGAQLLRHLGVQHPLIALHAHNEQAAAAQVLTRLAAGQSVAYISDAGTPAVSDPGAALVAQAQAAGWRTVPVPGPSSALAALSVAGDVVGTGFKFIGFLPAKGAERQAALAGALLDTTTLVIFEAPHRIEALCTALCEQAGVRRVTLCRELTKQFETVASMAASDLPAWLAADAQRLRGEFVLVVHAMPVKSNVNNELPTAAQHTLAVLLRELPLKQAVALAAEISGAPRNALYALALSLQADAP